MQRPAFFLTLCSSAWLLTAQAFSAATVTGDYYEERVSATCPDYGGFCRLDFSATPAGKELTLERVGCHLQVSNEPVISASIGVATTLGGPPKRVFPLAFPQTLQTTNYRFYNTNEEIKFMIGQGRYPFVLAEYLNAANGSMLCVIIGTLK